MRPGRHTILFVRDAVEGQGDACYVRMGAAGGRARLRSISSCEAQAGGVAIGASSRAGAAGQREGAGQHPCRARGDPGSGGAPVRRRSVPREPERSLTL